MKADQARTIAARALPLLDLTDLGERMVEPDVDKLCARAVGRFGAVAAVCLWPRFAALAKARLAGTAVKVAVVVNFPAGGEDAAAAAEETASAVSAGADEIDMVLPWRALLRGDVARAEAVVQAIRAATPAPRRLKVILETGELKEAARIAEASRIALAGGADFLKTSTGKVAQGATPEAAAIMLEAIRAQAASVGLKIAGGVRSVEDAARYLAQADAAMGPQWVTPATFRFGASGLLDVLEAALAGREAAPAAKGY
jgi:deoxyribose-phosphate aldolase